MVWNPFKDGRDETPGSGANDGPLPDAPRPDVRLTDPTLVSTSAGARPAATRAGRDSAGDLGGGEDGRDRRADELHDERGRAHGDETGQGYDSGRGGALWQNRSALDEERSRESGHEGVGRPEEDLDESHVSEALPDDDPQPLGRGPRQPADDSAPDAAGLDFRDAYGAPDDHRTDGRPDDDRTADDANCWTPDAAPEDHRERDREQGGGATAASASAFAAKRDQEDTTRLSRAPRDEDRSGDPGDLEPAPAVAAAPVAAVQTIRPEVGVVQSPPDSPDTDATVVQPASGAYDPIRVEQDRLAAERQARKEARLAALAPVQEQRSAAVAPVTPQKRVTDRFWPSLGLFLLRAATAFTMGVHGVNKLLNPSATTDLFANTILPYPRYFAFGVGVIEVAIAIALLFGLLTRLAGLGVALIAGGALGLVLWGAWSIFQPGNAGFVGEHELLLLAVGLLLLFVGGGAWSIDYGFRRRRAQVKAERQAMLDRP